MTACSRLPIAVVALALLAGAAGGLAARQLFAPDPAAAALAEPGDQPFERILYGGSLDDVCLDTEAQPQLVFRVPAGLELRLTDVDATAVGMVLLRRSQQRTEQVGFVVDHAAVGLGQSARSYVTPIAFGAGDELLVQAAGGPIEWAALRGVLHPVDPPLASR